MAINPLRVLPRFSPAPLPSSNDARTGERVMLEIIQHELLSQRQKQDHIDKVNEQFSNMLAKDPGTGLNPNIPYQKRALDKINAITLETSSKLQASKQDRFKTDRAVEEYQMRINSDPDIIGAKREAETLKQYGAHYFDLQKKGFVNDDKVKIVNDEVFKERDYPITFENLDLGSLSKDIYDIGKEILADRTSEFEDVDKDENDRIVSTVKGKTLMTKEDREGRTDAEAEAFSKERHKKYLVERFKDIFPEKDVKELEAVASNRVEDAFETLRGYKREGLKGTPAPPRASTAKNYQQKQAEAYTTGGIKMTGEYSLAEKDADGRDIIYDLDGEPVDLEAKWDTIGELNKKKLRDTGLVDFDKYQVAGSNKKINGSGLSEIPMGSAGLRKADASYNTTNGIGTKAEFTEDGFVATNNPDVLDAMGISIKYDKTKGKYIGTDNSGKPLKDSDFIVTGGADEKSFGEGTAEYLGLNKDESTPLMFKVKVKEIERGSAGVSNPVPKGGSPRDTGLSGGYEGSNKNLSFISKEESRDGNLSINPHDAGKPSIATLQLNDPGDQKDLLAVVGKDKEWNAILSKDKADRAKVNAEYEQFKDKNEAKDIRDAALKEVSKNTKAAYEKLYKSLTPEQVKKFDEKQEEIGRTRFWEPANKVFKERFGVEIPEEIKPLWAAMAGQHRKGMIGAIKEGGQGLVKTMDAKTVQNYINKGDLAGLIDYISDKRKEYSFVKKDSTLVARVERDRVSAKEGLKGYTSAKPAAADNPVVPKSQIDTFNIKKKSNNPDSLNIK